MTNQATDTDPLVIAGRVFSSRLIIGTGKYKDYAENAAAAEASGAEIVTVAVRRVNLSDPSAPMLVDYVSPEKYTFLPNTAGCFTGEDAVRTLRLAREAGGWSLVKLEVLGDEKTLYPNMPETCARLNYLSMTGLRSWSIAATTRLWRVNWKILAVAPSCRSARPSGQGWAFKILSIFA